MSLILVHCLRYGALVTTCRYIQKNFHFKKIYEKIVNLLSYQNRLQYKDFIIFSMLKAYRLNDNKRDEVFIFENVVRLLKKIDSKIIPIDLNNLQKRDFSNLFFSNQIEFFLLLP